MALNQLLFYYLRYLFKALLLLSLLYTICHIHDITLFKYMSHKFVHFIGNIILSYVNFIYILIGVHVHTSSIYLFVTYTIRINRYKTYLMKTFHKTQLFKIKTIQN